MSGMISELQEITNRLCERAGAYGTIREHTEPYGSIRNHTGAYGSIRVTYGSIREHTEWMSARRSRR
ncbi:hypothetical protein DPMN_045283 [Dreissena polymorpha]|uniref:Uncharacterized protein n=1 Tax=Dreissena polymorpha TaxID=45954 RepID=A0A9D4D5R1_DREPO|nr:hypothetical protein DPMN_045283 [Dreissena polymorpha]